MLSDIDSGAKEIIDSIGDAKEYSRRNTKAVDRTIHKNKERELPLLQMSCE